MAQIEQHDPYAVPPPKRDKGGMMVRTAVVAVMIAALGVTAYTLMGPQNAPAEQTFAAAEPPALNDGYVARREEDAPSVTQQAAQAPTQAAPAPSAPARRANRTPPAQNVSAEPAGVATPPALPAAADPAVAIPEIQPSAPAG